MGVREGENFEVVGNSTQYSMGLTMKNKLEGLDGQKMRNYRHPMLTRIGKFAKIVS